jgi:lipoprotein-releasing system permease protein
MNRLLPFEWIAALRFLKEGWMQTLFIISGVAIGVGVIVFMSALLSSLQANFIKRVLTSQPHIQIIPPDEVARPLRAVTPAALYLPTIQRPSQRLRSIDQWQRIRKQLLAREDVADVSPTVSASALAVRGDASRPITLTGIDPEVYFNIVKLPEYIIEGQPRVTSEDIIIGKELAKDLGVSLGDKVNVTAANRATRSLTISAIFDLGNKGANGRSTFVALRTAQALSNLVGGVTTIDVTVHDVYAADLIAQDIQAEIGMQADSWIKSNAQFFTAVNAQKTSNTAIRGFVGLSVAFGIASVLVVSVIQRSKDIGILRAMGASQGQILRVFLLQGGLLGFFGAIVGSVLGGQGFILLHGYMRQPDGTELFPIVLEFSLFVIAVVVATSTGVVAATVPALRAARLDPVAAIRG